METTEVGKGQVGAFSFHSKHADTLSGTEAAMFPRPKECSAARGQWERIQILLHQQYLTLACMILIKVSIVYLKGSELSIKEAFH